MHFEQQGSLIRITTFSYQLALSLTSMQLFDPRTGHCLLDVPTGVIFWPEVAGESEKWHGTALQVEPAESGAVHIRITAETTSPVLETLIVSLACYPDYLEIAASVPLKQDGQIAFWNVLAPDTQYNFFHAHHWRSRWGHHATYDTYNLYHGQQAGQQFDTAIPPEMVRLWTEGTELTTFSSDFSFAPHPSFFLLQRDTVMLGIGARDLPQGFGLEFAAYNPRLTRLRFNYGGEEHGLPYRAGEVADAPRLYLWLDHQQGVWESVDHYIALLQEDGMVPRRSIRACPHWWTRPLYCTWNDQNYLAGNAGYYNQPGEQFVGKDPVEAFDEEMLDTLLNTLEREAYHVGGVIIDDGWQATRGDWYAHPRKFPNLRAQIDRIHAMGMRAIIWLAPFDISEQSELRQHPEWLAGNGVLGKWQMPLLDYSNPRTQQEYVQPLLRYLFSDDANCLNADGIKTDFMADKVHANFPIANREWRGEERFILQTLQLFYDGLKQYKPDGMFLGCTSHPAFIGCQDLIRTFDAPFSQWQHADRNVMLRHFNPGNLVSLDMSETRSLADIEEHLRMAQQGNMCYEFGRIAVDPVTGEFALGQAYSQLLHRKLPMWG